MNPPTGATAEVQCSLNPGVQRLRCVLDSILGSSRSDFDIWQSPRRYSERLVGFNASRTPRDPGR